MVSCCILGGSGFVGSRLVARLANEGFRVTVPTRDPERCRHLRLMPTVRVIHGDVHDEHTLNRLVNGADVVINLIGILNESGRDGSGFHRAHVELTRKLIAACNTTGVRRLIQLSALNASGPDQPDVTTSHYLRSKGAAEALVRSSTLRWTILQPSVIFGPGDSFLNRFAGLLRNIPLAFPLAMPQARFAPVHVTDVVAAIAQVVKDPGTAGHIFQLCGPDIFTLRELVAMTAATLGLRRKVIGLPRPISRLQAAIMDFVPGKPFSTDNFRSLLTDSVGNSDGLRQLGVSPRPLRPNLGDTLRGLGSPDVRDTYRKLAGR